MDMITEFDKIRIQDLRNMNETFSACLVERFSSEERWDWRFVDGR